MKSLRSIRKRIRSVQETRKITSAMKMVAAAKLRRAEEKVKGARPYAEEINKLLSAVIPACLRASANADAEDLGVFLSSRNVVKRALVVFSTDRGLCGAFNSNLLREAEKELRREPKTTLILIGRKAHTYFSRRPYEIHKKVENFWPEFTEAKARELAQELAKGFLEGGFNRVDLLYNEFLSIITQKPKTRTLLPLNVEEAPESSLLLKPSGEKILTSLVPKAIEARFFLMCLNSLASEHGARLAAMDLATRNAGEMIDDLTLKVNRARQAQITKELSEIVTSAEAMK